ncbi:breast carcinoma-amplified sequence 4 [Exaiptasia diaphana]|uniref:Biogenesis of lysosome-related organelles complex 1 subunit 4 n=1 Tax=Exaiptasia diaphana TaxID=2652724 RepID=A0A913WRJ4_EXADI|nr:breast carcinoma-amplified sequence 4 [Exaiptasia diaphana]KXJ18538.1 Biogenesis of lysosome-related organelles complex 1 subunit 4 [Exaiptasia diaphana]
MADNKEGAQTEMEEEVIRKCTDNFAEYFQVDISDETKTIEDNIEDLLASLDEFSHLADTIRNDSSQILFLLLPELCAKCQSLPTVFNRIDQLEVFIDKVKQCVLELENLVDTAEQDLGSNSIQKVLNSIPYLGLIQKKTAPSVESEKGEFKLPTLYKTSDYFKPIPKEKSLDSEGIVTQLEVDLQK